MQAENGVDLGILEHAFLDHLLGAANLTRRQTFLCGLEDHFHGSRQTVFHPREHGGRAKKDRHVVVVTARVHHTHFLAVPLRRRGGLERQVALLGHRERIHVGPQRDDGSRPSAFEHTNDARGGDARRYGEAQLSQFVSDNLGGTRFAVAELRILMKVAPPRHRLRVQFGGEPLHIGSQRIRASGRLRLHRDGDQQHDQQKGSHGRGDCTPVNAASAAPSAKRCVRAAVRDKPEEATQAEMIDARRPDGHADGTAALWSSAYVPSKLRVAPADLSVSFTRIEGN